jgi:glycosyltransferase involved in cell wall biosynthesis
MKKLSICIPTYNRSDLLISQLEFLRVEILPFIAEIEIIVADNCSSEEHRNKIIDYHIQHNRDFELKLNHKNLGSIGNIYFLLENVGSEYVWFVSDDDVLLSGVLRRIMDIFSVHNDLKHIYLNYSVFFEKSDIIEHTPNMLGYSGYYPEGKEVLINLFKENGTVSMFITSCIYSVIPLKEYCSLRNKQTLIDPLLFSFKLATESIYIEDEIFVLERCTTPSWVDEGIAIFSWQIQYGLIELLNHSYRKEDIYSMIYNSYASNRGNYLKMLLFAPFDHKLSIIQILGISQFKLFLFSLNGYLFKFKKKYFSNNLRQKTNI